MTTSSKSTFPATANDNDLQTTIFRKAVHHCRVTWWGNGARYVACLIFTVTATYLLHFLSGIVLSAVSSIWGYSRRSFHHTIALVPTIACWLTHLVSQPTPWPVIQALQYVAGPCQLTSGVHQRGLFAYPNCRLCWPPGFCIRIDYTVYCILDE